MVFHLCIAHGSGYLTLMILPFTLTALTFGSCLYCRNAGHYKDEQTGSKPFCYKGIIGLPTWMP